MEFNKKLYLILLPFIIIVTNWLVTFFYFNDFNLDLKILLNFNDLAYFPFLISLSDFNFSPSYNDYFRADGLITFPYASIIFHAILFKFFGLFGYIMSQIIFVIFSYLIIYYFLKKTGVSHFASLLTTLIIFTFPIFLEFLSFFINSDLFIHIKDQIFKYHLNSYRYPRPLVTNIFFYISLCLLLNLIQNNDQKLITYFYLGLILSLLLQSFIFLFLLVGTVLFILIVTNLIKNKNFSKVNYKKIIMLLLTFFIFSIPFFIQNLFGQDDYSARMGLYSINFEQKIELLSRTLEHFFKLKYLIYTLFVFGFYFLFKKKFSEKFKKAYELFLIFFLVSFAIPFIFVIFSPYVIWYKHFYDVKNLVFLIGFILILAFVIDLFISNFKNKNIFLIMVCILFLCANIIYTSNSLKKNFLVNNRYYIELKNIISNTNNIIDNKKLYIFSNSGFINKYLIYKNQNILFPNGFNVSLSDNQLKTSMINSLKSIGFNEENFEKFLTNYISWRSSNNIGQITGYKYQFNSLYTYFDINDYKREEIELLNKNKLFLSESIALSKKEIENLKKIFVNHKIIFEIMPDLVIVDKRINDMDFVISKEYSTLINNKYFSLLTLNN